MRYFSTVFLLLFLLRFVFSDQRRIFPIIFAPGEHLYDQKVTKMTYPKANYDAMRNTLTTTYSMEQISLEYFQGCWSISVGNHMIFRSTKHGMPAYDNSIDTFYLDTFKLIKIRTSANEWEYASTNNSIDKIFLINPENSSDAYWKRIFSGGKTEIYKQMMNGRIKNGENIARGWLLNEIFENNRFKRFEYQHINGEYILRRVVDGENDKNIDMMTFIEYEYTSQNRRIDFRYGIKVEKSHIPRAVYVFKDENTGEYKWLSDLSGNPYAYVYENKNYLIKSAYLLDWAFGKAGEWQLTKITPYQSDISLKINRWWDGTETVREIHVTGGTAGESTRYDYFSYIQSFTDWHVYEFDSSLFPDALFKTDEIEMIDINNDKLVDVVMKNYGEPDLKAWYNLTNTVTGELKFSSCRKIKNFAIQDIQELHRGGSGLYDWNNDGIPDRIFMYPTPGNFFYQNLDVHCGRLSDTETYYIESDTLTHFNDWEEFSLNESEAYSTTDKISIDMDGDGLPDRVKADRSSGNLFVSHAKAYYSDTVEYYNFGGGIPRDITSADKVYADLADMNGDGLPDRVVKNQDILAVRFNTCDSFTDAVIFYSDPDINSFIEYDNSSNAITYDYIDFNGDGLLDRIRKRKGEQLNVWFNTGTGFLKDPFTLEKLSNDDIEITQIISKGISRGYSHQYIDLNGDGFPDRVVNTGNGKIMAAYNPCIQNGIPTGTLKSVTGPLSGCASIQKKYTYDSNKILLASVKQNEVEVRFTMTTKQMVKFNLFDVMGRRILKTSKSIFLPGVQTFQLHTTKNIKETGNIIILTVDMEAERYSFRIPINFQ